MKPYFLSAVVVALLLSPLVFAQDAELADENQALWEQNRELRDAAQQAAETQARPIRLVLPWSLMTSLTDEQRQQINQIRVQSREEIRAIEQRERAQIMELLSDEQKQEVETIEQQRAADRRARDAERRAAARQQQAVADDEDDDARN